MQQSAARDGAQPQRFKISFRGFGQRRPVKSDGGYHLLFSFTRTMIDLLEGFVDEPWVAELDLSTLKRVNARFHADGLERRDGDIIRRVRRRGGGYAYLYVALEFQSRVDPWMSLRLAIYVLLLYAHLIREKRLGPDGLLPPVYPLVLYNGSGDWTAELNLEALVAPGPDGAPWPWRPHFRYHVLEERKPTPDRPGTADNVTAILFKLEQCRTTADLTALVGRLAAALDDDGNAALRRAFLAWLKAVLVPRGISIDSGDMQQLSETRNMLADRVLEWEKDLLDRGRREGEAIGITKGEAIGEAIALAQLLEFRFGPLSSDWHKRIMSAAPHMVRSWLRRVIDAPSLDAVVGDRSVN